MVSSKQKLYKLTKGGFGSGANVNSVSITTNPTTGEKSANFVSRVQQKAEEIFGVGASLNTVMTNSGVFIRYPEYETNRKIAKMLIKIIELENELKTYKCKK